MRFRLARFTMLTLTAGLVAAALFGAGVMLAQEEPDTAEPAAPQAPIAAGITYQGLLTGSNGDPINAACDFRFSLWDEGGTAGAQIGNDHVLSGVQITDGRFTAQVNAGDQFGPNAFDGDARWLQIEVNCPDDDGFRLIGRQRLRPAPYAHFAPQAGSAPWSGLTGVPADLADGDDDTTYSAGSGLDLSDTTFSADTSAVQARVGDDCAVGSTVRAINADGTIDCSPDAPLNRNQPPAATISTTVDADGWAGDDTAVTIGSDGLPIIAEYVSTGGANLRVAHCDELDCSTATVTTIDSGGDVGNELAITLGADGLPLISYYDATNGDLKVAHCNNVACTDATASTLDSAGDVGRWTSITIGADGLGLISYHDAGAGELKVAHCANTACTSATHATAVDTGGADDVGEFSSITLGADGRGLISYYDRDNGDLKVAHCANTACTSAAGATAVSTDNVGLYTSLTTGADGLGVIAYWDTSNDQLSVAHCNTTACNAPAVSPVAGTGNAGNDAISIGVGADDLPVISYWDATAGALMVAHCTDASCGDAVTNTVDNSAANVGQATSLTIGVDGNPFISYFDRSNLRLRSAHCSNAFCAPHFRRR